MHYLGMTAQRMSATMEFHTGLVVLSAVIAIVTACVAFWILFRVLTFTPNYHSLRLASALIMGAALCGTNYTGMGSCSYAYTTESYATTASVLIDGSHAGDFSSHASLFICYWSVTCSLAWRAQTDSKANQDHSNNATQSLAAAAARSSPSHLSLFAVRPASVKSCSHMRLTAAASPMGTLFDSPVIETGDPVEPLANDSRDAVDRAATD